VKLKNIPRPNEQRKVEELLIKLAKMKTPISGKPAPIASGESLLSLKRNHSSHYRINRAPDCAFFLAHLGLSV